MVMAFPRLMARHSQDVIWLYSSFSGVSCYGVSLLKYRGHLGDPADCAAPDASLIIGTAWWFPALILAFGYLYVIQRHYSCKVNVSKDDQGLY